MLNGRDGSLVSCVVDFSTVSSRSRAPAEVKCKGRGRCRSANALEARLPRPYASLSKRMIASNDNLIHSTLGNFAISNRLSICKPLSWTIQYLLRLRHKTENAQQQKNHRPRRNSSTSRVHSSSCLHHRIQISRATPVLEMSALE
jgi:hypothetical protein